MTYAARLAGQFMISRKCSFYLSTVEWSGDGNFIDRAYFVEIDFF